MAELYKGPDQKQVIAGTKKLEQWFDRNKEGELAGAIRHIEESKRATLALFQDVYGGDEINLEK